MYLFVRPCWLKFSNLALNALLYFICAEATGSFIGFVFAAAVGSFKK